VAVAAAHADGKEAYARGIATELLEDFLAVEERFGAAREATEQEVIDSLRQVRRSVAPGQGSTQHIHTPLFPSDARPCASAFWCQSCQTFTCICMISSFSEFCARSFSCRQCLALN